MIAFVAVVALAGVGLFWPGASPTTAQNNQELIANGSFDQNKSGWWGQGSGGSTLNLSNGQLCLRADSSATKGYQAQIGSQRVNIQQGEEYRLSFDITGTAADQVTVGIQVAGPPYTKLFSSSVSVTTSRATRTYEFTANASVNEALLVFQLGTGRANTYCIDNVSLRRGTSTPTPPTPTPSTTTPATPPTPTPGIDLVRNGDFDDAKSEWWSNSNLGSNISNGQYCVTSPATATKAWQAQVGQGRINVAANTDYTLAFDLWASVAATISVRIQRGSSPWTQYVTHDVALNQGANRISLPANMGGDVAEAGLIFALGTGTNRAYCLDNVSLTAGGTSQPPTPPTPPTPVADNCVAYGNSPLYRTRAQTIWVNPNEDWESRIVNAAPNTEIRLADGTYRFTGPRVTIRNANITIRSASGNREAVQLVGQGYGPFNEGLLIQAANTTIADITIRDTRNHGIHIQPQSGASGINIYNVGLYDIGTQMIKGSSTTPNRDGVLACSRIGYNPGKVRGDYIAAIDVHSAAGWVVRDNEIFNFMGDGSGCEVDIDCGRYEAIHPALLFWNNSRDVVIERNTLVDTYRAITLGLGNGFDGGVVRNNFIYQSRPGDAGIELQDVRNLVVEHNTVLVNGYRGAIEYSGATNVIFRNNLINQPLYDRSSSARGLSSGITDVGNIVSANNSDFVAVGDVHLRAGSRAIGQGVSSDAIDDIDGESRVNGRDVGADQFS